MATDHDLVCEVLYSPVLDYPIVAISTQKSKCVDILCTVLSALKDFHTHARAMLANT